MAVEIDGAVELKRALQLFTPDLAVAMEKKIGAALTPIVEQARSFVPSNAPLSTWRAYSTKQKGQFPWFNYGEIIHGIGYTTSPSMPNRKGFSYAAQIFNQSAVGAIIETAGRRHPNGRPQSPMVQVYTDAGTPRARYEGKNIRNRDKRKSMSDNPNAGLQFINSLGAIFKVKRAKGQKGRVSRKMNGRLIYRAWGENQGKAYDAVNRAIEEAITKFKTRTKGTIVSHKTIQYKRAT